MHLYGFYVIDPFIIVYEPPYQTYSSVGQAGFRRRFPRMNDHTNFSFKWGSLRLAPTIVSAVYIQYRKFWRDWLFSRLALSLGHLYNNVGTKKVAK